MEPTQKRNPEEIKEAREKFGNVVAAGGFLFMGSLAVAVVCLIIGTPKTNELTDIIGVISFGSALFLGIITACGYYILENAPPLPDESD
jgi:hypothetical protein